MNQTLARYLFFNETLYNNVEVQAETPVPLVVREESNQQSVVEIQQPKSEIRNPIAEIQQPFKLKHKVLLLVEKMQDEHRELLGKILMSVSLSFEHVDLIEVSKNLGIAYQQIIADKTTNQMISFGVGMGKLNFDLVLQPYVIKNIEGVDFLLADALDVIAQDACGEKRKLWTAFKILFKK